MGKESEAIEMQLLEDMYNCLCQELNSLGGKAPGGLFKNYFVYTSLQVGRCVEAYIFLRRNDMVAASKLLVRPILELMFKQQAVLNDPEMLFRIAYTEHLDLFRFGSEDDKDNLKNVIKIFEEELPDCRRIEQEVRVSELARAANMKPMYKEEYRQYCIFSHGSFEACMAAEHESDQRDNTVVVFSLSVILLAFRSVLDFKIPELDNFMNRLESLP